MDVSTPRLGQMLLHQHLMDGRQILECLEFQAQGGQPGGRILPLGRIALEKGYVSPEKLHETLHKQSILARNRQGNPVVRGTPGKLREEYQILRTLGRDAHFFTFQARHAASGAMVALRVLDPGAEGPKPSQEQEVVTRVERLQRLQHPNLQPLISGGRLGADLFFAAEYLDAVSLQRLIRESAPMDWRWCWDLACQIASALEYAHGEKCFHGGIRPSNILIGRGGRAMLAHLGLIANERDNTLALLEMFGEIPVTMAPEHAGRNAAPQARTDLYSLGASLHHAATGHAVRTVGAARELQIPPAGMVDPVDLNPDIPSAFARILQKMIAPDPEDRYPSAWELLNDLSEMKPLVDLSVDLPKFHAERNERIDAHLAEATAAPPAPVDRAPGAATPAGRTAGLARRLCGAAVAPLVLILILAPALTYAYRHVYAHRVFLLQGEHLYFRGEMAGALAKFRKAESLRPDLPELQERILSFALETRDYPLASRQIDRLRKLRPGEEKRLGLLQVDLLLWGGNPDAALDGYRDFARVHGEDLEVLLRTAQAQAAKKDLNGALGTYAAIHASHPDEPRALLEMARLASGLGLHEQSRRLYAHHLKKFPETTAVLAEYARSLEACRDFEDAARVYGRIVLLAKDRGEWTFARARALLWHGDADAASRILRELDGKVLERPEWGIALARAHESLREFARAEEVWKDLGGLHPTRIDLALELGRLYEQTGRYDQALAQLQSTMKRFGATAELLASMGRIHAARKDPREALALFLRAARMEPGSRAYALEVARTLIWLERPQEALEALDAMGARDLLTPEIEVERARVFFRLGMRAEAKSILATLTGALKDDSPLLKTLGELELEGSPEPGKARLYETYLQKHPEDLEALRRFAQLLRAAGDHARAWPLYRRRLEVEPRTPSLVLEASEEASWAGDPDGALRLLESIRQTAVGTK